MYCAINIIHVLQLQDLAELLKPEDEESHGECSGESSRTAATETKSKPASMAMDVDIEGEEEEQTQVGSSAASMFETSAFLRSKYTQTIAVKPTTRSVKTQTLIDATSSFFHERKQAEILPLESDEQAEKSHSVDAAEATVPQSQSEFEVVEESGESSASEKSDKQDVQYSPYEATSTESEDSCEEGDSAEITQILLTPGIGPFFRAVQRHNVETCTARVRLQ
jgi:hypothetical protein